MSEHTQIAEDVVSAEFDRFLEAMDLVDKTDVSRLSAEDSKALAEAKATIFAAMRKGSLVIDEHGQPVYTPQVGDQTPLTFYEPSGAELMAMDQAKTGHTIAKQNALLGAITKTGPKRFASMKQRDLRVCSNLLVLFLA